MKKLIPIIALLLFFGCGKEEKGISSDITGKWFVTEIKADGSYQIASESCFNGYWSEFGKDGKYNSFNSCDEETYEGNYKKTDNIVTCFVGSSTVIYKIIARDGDNIEFNMNDIANNIDMKAVKR